MRIRPRHLALVALVLVPVPGAHAAPPPNDAPTAPGVFEPFETRSGPAGERQAVAELAEAQGDPGVPACLGPGSFARTVWYRLEGTPAARELRIEASGRTTSPVDLAAFIQPGPQGAPILTRPNVCDGLGAGGDDLGEDRTAALVFRVPAYHTVYLQVGRRGPRGSADDERVVLLMREAGFVIAAPAGDRAGSETPAVRQKGETTAPLNGSTITDEDPAIPACQATSTVWRKAKIPSEGRWTFMVEGEDVGTLSLFTGAAPERSSFAGCVDREGSGPLVLPGRFRRGRTVWVRIGADRIEEGSTAHVQLDRSTRFDVASGGACLGQPNSRLGGELVGADRTVKRRNRSRRITLRMRVDRGPVCDAQILLIGPKRRIYGRVRIAMLRGRGEVIVLRRTRKLRKGRYRLRVDAAGLARVRTPVPSSVLFRLR